MGEISKRLHRKLTALVPPGHRTRPLKGWRTETPVPSIVKLIAEGYDPVHAAYIIVQNLTSAFSENVSQLPEMRNYANWAFFDHRIETTTDTLAGCLIEANDTICMNPHQLGALKFMSHSRMGNYEHKGTEGGHVWLRELITDKDFLCYCTSGYRGKVGELWCVRRFPNLEPELAKYHIVFTTPYVLIGQSKEDWIAYLKRSMVGSKAPSEADALYQLLKFGLGKNYWNEFVFVAYHHHQADAIFLTGIPDTKATLPHA